MILVSILALFLINLIQVQYYLKNQNDSSIKEINHSNKSIDNTFIDDEKDDFYSEDDLQTFDDLLYDLFEKYEEFLYDSNTIYENTL